MMEVAIPIAGCLLLKENVELMHMLLE